ncbi:MAG: hypothetical protein U1E78_10690 [Gammaproteobacteria bacterium]
MSTPGPNENEDFTSYQNFKKQIMDPIKRDAVLGDDFVDKFKKAFNLANLEKYRSENNFQSDLNDFFTNAARCGDKDIVDHILRQMKEEEARKPKANKDSDDNESAASKESIFKEIRMGEALAEAVGHGHAEIVELLLNSETETRKQFHDEEIQRVYSAACQYVSDDAQDKDDRKKRVQEVLLEKYPNIASVVEPQPKPQAEANSSTPAPVTPTPELQLKSDKAQTPDESKLQNLADSKRDLVQELNQTDKSDQNKVAQLTNSIRDVDKQLADAEKTVIERKNPVINAQGVKFEDVRTYFKDNIKGQKISKTGPIEFDLSYGKGNKMQIPVKVEEQPNGFKMGFNISKLNADGITQANKNTAYAAMAEHMVQLAILDAKKYPNSPRLIFNVSCNDKEKKDAMQEALNKALAKHQSVFNDKNRPKVGNDLIVDATRKQAEMENIASKSANPANGSNPDNSGTASVGITFKPPLSPLSNENAKKLEALKQATEKLKKAKEELNGNLNLGENLSDGNKPGIANSFNAFIQNPTESNKDLFIKAYPEGHASEDLKNAAQKYLEASKSTDSAIGQVKLNLMTLLCGFVNISEDRRKELEENLNLFCNAEITPQKRESAKSELIKIVNSYNLSGQQKNEVNQHINEIEKAMNVRALNRSTESKSNRQSSSSLSGIGTNFESLNTTPSPVVERKRRLSLSSFSESMQSAAGDLSIQESKKADLLKVKDGSKGDLLFAHSKGKASEPHVEPKAETGELTVSERKFQDNITALLNQGYGAAEKPIQIDFEGVDNERRKAAMKEIAQDLRGRAEADNRKEIHFEIKGVDGEAFVFNNNKEHDDNEVERAEQKVPSSQKIKFKT